MALALYFMSKNMKKIPKIAPPPVCCISTEAVEICSKNGLIHSLEMQELQSLSGLIRTVYCCGELLAFFAGIWCGWMSVRKLAGGETTDDLC